MGVHGAYDPFCCCDSSALVLCLLLCCCPDPGAAPLPAQPAVTSAESPEIREFQKIEDTWSNAINQRDQYGLELVLSPLFVDVSASGDITTRNQQLAQLITGEDKTLHLEQRVITVRMLGDIAVANGTYMLHHKVNSAQVDEKGVFTHVFERAARRLGVHQLAAHRAARGLQRQGQEAVQRRNAVPHPAVYQRQGQAIRPEVNRIRPL